MQVISGGNALTSNKALIITEVITIQATQNQTQILFTYRGGRSVVIQFNQYELATVYPDTIQSVTLISGTAVYFQGFTTNSTVTQSIEGSIDATIVNPVDANGNMKVDLEADSTGHLTNIQNKLSNFIALTVTPLGANATFVSGFNYRNEGTSLNGTVKAFGISDQAFTLYIDYSNNSSIVDYSIEAASAPIGSPYVAGANGSQFAKIIDELIDPYFRYRIVNGPTAQTYLTAALVAENN